MTEVEVSHVGVLARTHLFFILASLPDEFEASFEVFMSVVTFVVDSLY